MKLKTVDMIQGKAFDFDIARPIIEHVPIVFSPAAYKLNNMPTRGEFIGQIPEETTTFWFPLPGSLDVDHAVSIVIERSVPKTTE